MDEISRFLEPNYVRYIVLGIFGIAGFSKLLPFQQRELSHKFPFLPAWLWQVTAIWELVLVVLYLMDYKRLSFHMCFVLYSGAVYATLATSNSFKRSIFSQTYGIALLPPLGCALLTYHLSLVDRINLLPEIAASILFGAGVGYAITQ